MRPLVVVIALVLGASSAAARAIHDPAHVFTGFESGTYDAVAIVGGKTYTARWVVTVTGNQITGNSYWDCCPGPRTDPLSGSVNGAQVTIVRNCAGQGAPSDCRQTFSGHVTADGGVEGAISGSFIHAGDTFTLMRRGTPPPATTGMPEVTIVSIQEDVSVRHGNGPWEVLAPGTKLTAGDAIHTGPESKVVLHFSDGSSLTVSALTQLEVANLLNETDRIKIELFLKLGELKAQVRPKETIRSDFSIRTPTASVGSRGTIFSVFYDPGSAATIVSVSQHSVVVDPVRAGLPTVTVGAGREVQVTTKAVSPLAPIGKADARGGIDRVRAHDLVLRIVGRSAKRCGFSTPRTTGASSVKPAAAGWLVTIRVTGNLNGVSTWAVAGRTVTPLNALAKKIAAGCR